MGSGDRSTPAGLSRRQYAQLVTGGGLAGLAGCLSTIEEFQGGTEPEDTTREGPRQRAITLAVEATPENTNYNEWADGRNTAAVEFVSELAAPENAETLELALSGQSYEADWIDDRDAVEVPAMLANYELEEPDAIVEEYDERLTYWDGTPLDAEAMNLQAKLRWYNEAVGNALEPEAYPHEVVDDFTFRRNVDATSQPILESQVFGEERVPLHPDFTRPHVEALEDATTESEAQEALDALAADSLTLLDVAENGWGSGLYELRSTDDVSADRMVLHRRDDHPTAHATVEQMEVLFASGNQQKIVAEEGGIDLAGGVVGEGGDINRDVLPDHVQQIDQYLGPNSDTVLFNFENHHLQRLWVRRAIVALVDWHEVGAQGWGEDSSIAAQHHTGLHTSVSEETFDEEFLEALHQYPLDYDLETAVDWLERAGYSGSRSEGWESPEGEPLELTITANAGVAEHIRGCRTIQGNLRSLGVDAELEILPEEPGFAGAVGGNDPTFDLAMMWSGTSEPWEYYWAMGGWWESHLVGGSPDNFFWMPREDYPEVDNYGVPLAPEVPTEVGSISAPREAGRAPSLAGGEQIELPPTVHSFRDAGADPATFQEGYENCARFYNYYLPQFHFHDIAWGAWGNVRDFEFPQAGNPANRTTKGDFSGHDYLVLAGHPQYSEDDDYPQPGSGSASDL